MITHLLDNAKTQNVCHAMFYRLARPLQTIVCMSKKVNHMQIYAATPDSNLP